jgi:hypothetical protein
VRAPYSLALDPLLSRVNCADPSDERLRRRCPARTHENLRYVKLGYENAFRGVTHSLPDRGNDN